MKVTTRKAIRTQFNKLKRRLHNLDLTYILQEDSTNEHLEPHYVFQNNLPNITSRLKCSQ